MFEDFEKQVDPRNGRDAVAILASAGSKSSVLLFPVLPQVP